MYIYIVYSCLNIYIYIYIYIYICNIWICYMSPIFLAIVSFLGFQFLETGFKIKYIKQQKNLSWRWPLFDCFWDESKKVTTNKCSCLSYPFRLKQLSLFLSLPLSLSLSFFLSFWSPSLSPSYTHIHTYIYMYIYIYIYIYTHTHTYIYIYIYAYFFNCRSKERLNI